MGKISTEEKIMLGILSVLYFAAFPIIWVYKKIAGLFNKQQ